MNPSLDFIVWYCTHFEPSWGTIKSSCHACVKQQLKLQHILAPLP